MKVLVKTYAASVSTKYGEPITNTTSRMSKNHDNIILYGVDECPSGMSQQARFQSDLSSIVNTLHTHDSTRGGTTSSYAPTRLRQSHMTLMAFRTFFLAIIYMYIVV